MLRQTGLLVVIAFVALHAEASFHEWRIQQVFSDASGKVQYIQMGGVEDSGESFLSGQSVSSGSKSFTFPTDLPSEDTAGHSVLFGTASYAKQAGAVAPDYVLPDHFFSPAGDTINYAGVDSFTFTSQQLPKDGLLALNVDFSKMANAQKNFAGEAGSIRVQSGPPSAVPLPPAAYPGMAMLGALVLFDLRRRYSAALRV